MNKKIFYLSKEIPYSIIIPVFNEEQSVSPLFYSLKEVMNGLGEAYEVIFIDDGSTDSTLKQLDDLSIAHNCLHIIHFNFNRGQGKAIEEGFRNARGRIIITMDGDLQNDPQDIPNLIFEIKKGFDLICGWRYTRCDTFIKKMKSKIGNYIQRQTMGLSLHDISCTMRAYRKETVTGIIFKGRFDFSMLPYIISQIKNIKMTEVKIHSNHRKFGKTKYQCLDTIFGTAFDFIKLFYLQKIWKEKNLNRLID